MKIPMGEARLNRTEIVAFKVRMTAAAGRLTGAGVDSDDEAGTNGS
jgi:hypothetical protein